MKTLKNNGFEFLYVYLISDFSRYKETPITEQVETDNEKVEEIKPKTTAERKAEE